MTGEKTGKGDLRLIYVIEEFVDGEWCPAACDFDKSDMEEELQELREDEQNVRLVEYVPRFELIGIDYGAK